MHLEVCFFVDNLFIYSHYCYWMIFTLYIGGIVGRRKDTRTKQKQNNYISILIIERVWLWDEKKGEHVRNSVHTVQARWYRVGAHEDML